MSIDIKKQTINDKLYDIITLNEYSKNKSMYDPKVTAIERDGIAYPVKTRNDSSPGFFSNNNIMCYYRQPDGENIDQYRTDNAIDFSDINNIQDAIEKSASLKEIEKRILTTPDKIYQPIIEETNEPALMIIKEAIIEKHIDINNYKDRYEKDFANHKKPLDKGDKISLKILVSHVENLDLEAELILRDKSPDVPNPMGKEISIKLNNYVE